MQPLHSLPARFGVDSSHANIMLYPVLHCSIRGPVAEQLLQIRTPRLPDVKPPCYTCR
jgi:hypothetical protein